jgi:hypothetical protein
LGLLDPDGRVRYGLLSGVPELDTGSDLKVADDGSELEIALAPGGRGRRRFSVQRGTLTPVASPSPDLSSALTASAGWRVTRWQQPGGPLVNGQRIALEPYEEAHVFAIARRAQALLLGTEWSLRAIDERGAERWRVRTSTAVRAVNATADGRFALAALADGTIHWYRLADGTPALTLFLHADGENWVAWTPSGYYASSPYGDTLVGWHVNRGPDRSPDFFRAVQFERELYRPDLIAGNLRGTKSAAAGDDEGRLLLEVSPPRIRIVSTASSAGTGTARVRIMAESTGLPMRDMVVYLNDIPLTPARERLLGRAEAVRFVREIDLPLLAPENDLRIEVFNGRSLGVEERLVTGTPVAVPSRRSRGDLYLLAVGANEFPALDHGLFLSYAASDAAEFARALEGQTGGFRHVHARILRDGAELPVRSAVLAALEQLKQATGEDTVVVFLASHGVSDAAGNYFFVPRDARRADIDALLQGRALASDSSLIGWLAFFDALRNTAGRRLLIVDTCQAHDISGRVREFSLLKRSASSHIGFILASKGDEESQEYSPGRHGLFTYALLQGLQGAADADHDGGTTVGEWFQYAAGLVEQLRDRRIGPQTPQFLAPPVLQMMEIARTPAMTIPAPRS